jgi:hypothetical protein
MTCLEATGETARGSATADISGRIGVRLGV